MSLELPKKFSASGFTEECSHKKVIESIFKENAEFFKNEQKKVQQGQKHLCGTTCLIACLPA